MTLTPRARESTDGLARALDNDHLLVLRLRGRRRRCGPSIGSRDRPGYPSRSGRRHRKRRAATRGSGGRGTAPERRPGPHTQVEARQETPAARAGRVGPVRARRPDVAAVEADPRVSGRSPGCRYRARPAVGEPNRIRQHSDGGRRLQDDRRRCRRLGRGRDQQVGVGLPDDSAAEESETVESRWVFCRGFQIKRRRTWDEPRDSSGTHRVSD